MDSSQRALQTKGNFFISQSFFQLTTIFLNISAVGFLHAWKATFVLMHAF